MPDGRVPTLDTNGRLPNAYAPQVALDAFAKANAAVPNTPEGRAALAASAEVSATIGTLVSAGVPPLVAAALVADPTIRATAVQAVTDAAAGGGLVGSDANDAAEFQVKFDDGDPFVRATEARGIFSPVEAQAVKLAGGGVFETSPLWLWRLRYSNGETAIGRRVTGEVVMPGYVSPEPPEAPAFIMVGDSLAEGRAGSADSALSTALARPVTNIGIGGQNSAQIAARFGADPTLITVQGNKIPASGSVTVTAETANLGSLTAAGTRSFVGVLAGIRGTLTIQTVTPGSSYVKTFTRTTPGTPTPVPPSSPFQTGFAYRTAAPIIRLGRNGFKTESVEHIVGKVRRCVDWTRKPKHALVLPIPPWTTDTPDDLAKLNSVNAGLRDAFPTMWLDDAAYLRSTDTLASVGITATSQDIADIAAGFTPQSFRTDQGHPNAAAYTALNNLYVSRYQGTGY